MRRVLEALVAAAGAHRIATFFLLCQVSKAKTSASSLAAELTDTTAELRASNGRLEDASTKVCKPKPDHTETNPTKLSRVKPHEAKPNQGEPN